MPKLFSFAAAARRMTASSSLAAAACARAATAPTIAGGAVAAGLAARASCSLLTFNHASNEYVAKAGAIAAPLAISVVRFPPGCGPVLSGPRSLRSHRPSRGLRPRSLPPSARAFVCFFSRVFAGFSGFSLAFSLVFWSNLFIALVSCLWWLMAVSSPVAVGGSRSLPASFGPLVVSVCRVLSAAGRPVFVSDCSGGASAFARPFAASVFSVASVSAAVPFRARLVLRARALVAAAGSLVLFVGPSFASGGSRGSLGEARFAASRGLPVVVFPCGFPASSLPSLGAGSWVPAGRGVWASAFRWSPASQPSLF